ncbi:MAG: metallophosphoesterase [Cyanobacteria bacterium P01_D01_bin.73]
MTRHPEQSKATATAVRQCRFAVVSDSHIALPQTVWNGPNRLHMVEVGIPALEQAFEHFEASDIDFLLMPGDLTQHGEPENHRWLADRLAQLPFPTYVIPGNHDFPARSFYKSKTTQQEFIEIYRKFGYQDSGDRPYYNQLIFPGIRLIGLNSNQLSADGQFIEGRIDSPQIKWLDQQLKKYSRRIDDDAEIKNENSLSNELILLMVHHNIAEHIPHQSTHPLGKRYILPDVVQLQNKLRNAGVKCVFTGHLHVQDIVNLDGLFAITTGSLIAYPHPYRIMTLYEVDSPLQTPIADSEEGIDSGNSSSEGTKQRWLEIETHRIQALPDWDDLTSVSRRWAGDHSGAFMTQLLAKSSLDLSLEESEIYSKQIQYLWADVARGDQQLSFPDLPENVRDYCENFGVRSRNNQLRFSANHIALRID